MWKTIFGVECPSCGMTHAFIHLLKLELIQALQANKLIIVVIPAALIYIIVDFKKYWKNYKKTHTEI
ncbi:DUF2752 domain-containing protein [Ornithobacterium rhinotracheale]|uniref:DUF2752 domain-containing protein n=1 Tax=Ornithobacterium rhinotracheale TaxID=28251 RepID=UPI001FF3AC2E|nr:DUF2752 domain-containing protein [Ornithobacterium rhinotracheale]MCK0204214.1 DUF2752 domain-containing protein [Ornithobacterium rhinotracheale]